MKFIPESLEESQNFERGIEPLKAMKIGMIKWSDLKEGTVLQCIKTFYLNANQKITNSEENSIISIDEGEILVVREVDEGKKDWVIWHIQYDDMEDYLENKDKNESWRFDYFSGTLAQFEKRFRILQRSELSESANFERGMDPKKTMDIGKETSERPKIESTKWFYEDWNDRGTEIEKFIPDYYGYPILLLYIEEAVYPWIATTTFDKTDRFMAKSLAYRQIQRIIERKVGIEESQHFERGVDPKKSIRVGLRAPRRFETIDEFTDYIIAALPLIFDGKVPDDILSREEDGMIPQSYYEKITDFLIEIGHEMPNGSSDWGYGESAGKDFDSWPAFVVARLEVMLGQKRWDRYY